MGVATEPAPAVVNVHDAKTNLSKLLARVEAGERITIARAGRPIAHLVPIRQRAWRDVFGVARDLPPVPDDFNDPDPEVEALFGGAP